jgi:hypothetical protein
MNEVERTANGDPVLMKQKSFKKINYSNGIAKVIKFGGE